MNSAEPNSYPWLVRLLFWVQRRKYGQVLNPILAWGKIPHLLYPFVWFYLRLERKSSPLSPVLRSLVQVRVSQLNWCAFCIDLNASLLMERTGSRQKFEALPIWKDSLLFSTEEKLALEYAEAMTLSTQKVTPELREKLKKLFSEKQILELTALIAYQNLSAKFNSALDIAPQGLCQVNTV